MRDATELARLLGARAQSLAAELLPAGQREGAEWRVGSLAGERGRSLAVHLIGSRAGVWADFSSGERGDALDLVAAVLFRGETKPAMDWARKWLGMDSGPVPAASPRSQPAKANGPDQPDAEAEARRRAAVAMFVGARPELRGTPAAEYLAGRGIDLAELGRQPRSLRFAPSLANRESGRSWPALLAAISDAAGRHVATHRTWLAQDEAGAWRKAPLRDAKMTLGSYAGGTIRLWRGASGKPLSQTRPGERVAIAEGIETGLSVVCACPDLRVLCAVSLANMGRIMLPPAVTEIIICADNDGDNPAAAHTLQRAIDHFAAEGRLVRIARPPAGLKDFNDWLRAETT